MICTASSPLVEAIINHPTVRPTAQTGKEKLYCDALLKAGAVMYADEDGRLVIFVPEEPQLFRAHIFMVATARGKGGVEFGRAVLRKLFSYHGAQSVVASAPLVLPAVSVYCRMVGFAHVGRDLLEDHFQTEAGKWVA